MKKCKKEARSIEVMKTFKKFKKGATVADIAQMIGIPFSWVAPRVTELSCAGLLVATGNKRLNPETGKLCRTYKIAGSK